MMNQSRRVIFFHAPQSRSVGARMLMEELQADHELRVLNLKTGEQRQPEYLRVNPMGKVPAVLHGDALVTEQPAVYQYMAELYPERGLSPAPGDALRGPYLRWLAFYGSSFEPAVVDKSMGRDGGRPSMSPYGDYDTVMQTLRAQLAQGPWLLGDRFTAADVLWGAALGWMLMFKLAPEWPEFVEYARRFEARPAVARTREKEAELLASMSQ
jgi:glutathione S-transferase